LELTECITGPHSVVSQQARPTHYSDRKLFVTMGALTALLET